MSKPSEQFKTNLTAIIAEKTGAGEMSLWAPLVDKLMELAMNLFDQCIGQLSPAEVGARVAKASESVVDRSRFRKRVKKHIYDAEGKDYDKDGGKLAADSTLLAFKQMGEPLCVDLANELTQGENWWPNEEFMMG